MPHTTVPALVSSHTFGALEKIVAEVGKQLDEKIANVERDAARRNNQPGG